MIVDIIIVIALLLLVTFILWVLGPIAIETIINKYEQPTREELTNDAYTWTRSTSTESKPPEETDINKRIN